MNGVAAREDGAHDDVPFELGAVVRLGEKLTRRDAARRSTDVLSSLVTLVYDTMREGDSRRCALARAYATLDGVERQFDVVASRGPETEFGGGRAPTRGADPIYLADENRANESPLLAALVEKLAVERRDVFGPRRRVHGFESLRAFHDENVVGGPFEPAADFARAYRVACVFGFGGVLPTGDLVAVVVHSGVPVGARAARLLVLLAHYASLALLDASDVLAALEEGAARRVRNEVLSELLSLIGNEALQAERSSALRIESDRTVAQDAAEARRAELVEHNRKLQRMQRAMLNVIEDLRGARAELERRVSERTAELFTANAMLKTRNQELEDFVYIASHDLQEPLRTVSGYLQIIDRRYRGQLGTDADEFITFSIEGAQRMQALIESLLAYSRVSTKVQSLERIALDDALDAALENLAFSKDSSGAVIERRPLPSVRADRMQMVQLFQNLLGNAMKFNGPSPPRIEIGCEQADGEWVVTVRDHGIGFNPKYADRIFKMFRRLQRSTPGTGVGLAICKKIVERHGGKIHAESCAGDGAAFIFTLPLPLS